MSYNISMFIDTGGAEPHYIEGPNYTSNCAAMWNKALGIPLYDMEGWFGERCKQVLRNGIARLQDDIGQYREMNPENGWGDVEGALEFLQQILALCCKHPLARLHVSH